MANCIAVGKRGEDFLPEGVPPQAMRRRDGEAEGLAALGVADDAGRGPEAKAQGLDGDLVEPADVAKKELGEVISDDRQGKDRFGGPEGLAAKSGR